MSCIHIIAATAVACVVGAGIASPASAVGRPARPVVSSVSPRLGARTGGALIKVHGKNLRSLTSVHFGSARAAVVHRISSTLVEVRAPAHSASHVDVTATNSGGTSLRTTRDRFDYVEPPEPPTDLQAKSATNGDSLQLTWTLSTTPDVQGYYIRWNDGTVAPTTISQGQAGSAVPSTATSYTDGDLSPGQTRSYAVIAYLSDGVSYSVAATITTTTIAPYRPGTLPEPTGLTVSPTPSGGSCPTSYTWAGWVHATDHITLSAYTRDNYDDSRPVAVRFTVWSEPYRPTGFPDADAEYLYAPDDPQTLSAPVPASGGTASVNLDAARFTDGGQYGFMVDTVYADGTPPSIDWHYPGEICSFGYDATPPSAMIMTSTYIDSSAVPLGQPFTLSVSAADGQCLCGSTSEVDHFVYAFSLADLEDGQGTATPSEFIDGPAYSRELTFTPTTTGPMRIWVEGVDEAGNVGPPGTFDFNVVPSG